MQYAIAYMLFETSDHFRHGLPNYYAYSEIVSVTV